MFKCSSAAYQSDPKFCYLFGDAALLELAIIQYAIQKLTKKVSVINYSCSWLKMDINLSFLISIPFILKGFTTILPPDIVKPRLIVS